MSEYSSEGDYYDKSRNKLIPTTEEDERSYLRGRRHPVLLARAITRPIRRAQYRYYDREKDYDDYNDYTREEYSESYDKDKNESSYLRGRRHPVLLAGAISNNRSYDREKDYSDDRDSYLRGRRHPVLLAGAISNNRSYDRDYDYSNESSTSPRNRRNYYESSRIEANRIGSVEERMFEEEAQNKRFIQL